MYLDISNIIFKKIIQIEQLLWLLRRRIDCNRAKEGVISLKAESVAIISGIKLIHSFSLEGNTVFDKGGWAW